MTDEMSDRGHGDQESGSLLNRVGRELHNLIQGEDDAMPSNSGVDETVQPASDAPDNRGNFGTPNEIVTDNEAVQHAAGPYTAESLAEGPADTDPDITQGSLGG